MTAKEERTTDELVNEVANELGIKDAYSTVDTEDAALILARYQDRHAEETPLLFFWDVDDNIPAAVFRGVVDLVTIDCRAPFGEMLDTITKEALTKAARQRVRNVAKVQASGHRQEASFF